MQECIVQPGDIVASDFGSYHHWSIVSDNLCSIGKPMLISATQRNGTVKEEPWDIVTKGKLTFLIEKKSTTSLFQLLERARSQVDIWNYSVKNMNCEHFINWVVNEEPHSQQVKNAISGAITGAVAVGLISKDPTILKFLAGAAVVGGIAVYLTEPSMKALQTNQQYGEQ